MSDELPDNRTSCIRFLSFRSDHTIGDHGLPHLHDHPLPQRAQQTQVSGVDSEQSELNLQQDDVKVERIETMNR